MIPRTMIGLLCATWLFAQTITTLVGTGKPGFDDKTLNNPYGLTIGPDKALYFCDIDNHLVRRFDLQTKQLTTVAGNGKLGNTGDGGPAVEASLGQPYEVRFDKKGHMFFVDMPNHVVRRVDRVTKVITTVAGTGQAGSSGDGGAGIKAQFRQPHSIAFDKEGRLLVCDIGNHRVRRIDLKKDVIETWLGTGDRKPTPDGAPLAGTPLNGPRAIDVDSRGNLYLALREGNVVLKVDPKKRRYTAVAGTGEKGLAGDNGPATAAKLNGPKGVALSPDGSLYLADTENHVVRKIDLKTGLITTAAGSGQRGDGPEDDPKLCKMNRPHGIFVDRSGNVYIADSEAHRIRLLK